MLTGNKELILAVAAAKIAAPATNETALKQELPPTNDLPFEARHELVPELSRKRDHGIDSVPNGWIATPVGSTRCPSNVETSRSGTGRVSVCPSNNSTGTPCAFARSAARAEPQMPVGPSVESR